MTRIIAGYTYQAGEVVKDRKILDRIKANIEKYYVFSSTDVRVPHLNAHYKSHEEIDKETMGLILENNQLDLKLYEWVRERGSSIRPKNLIGNYSIQ